MTRTWTPERRISCARSVFRWMEAALDVLYAMWCCEVRVMPDIDEILMTFPVCPAPRFVAADSSGRNATVVKKCLYRDDVSTRSAEVPVPTYPMTLVRYTSSHMLISSLHHCSCRASALSSPFSTVLVSPSMPALFTRTST